VPAPHLSHEAGTESDHGNSGASAHGSFRSCGSDNDDSGTGFPPKPSVGDSSAAAFDGPHAHPSRRLPEHPTRASSRSRLQHRRASRSGSLRERAADGAASERTTLARTTPNRVKPSQRHFPFRPCTRQFGGPNPWVGTRSETGAVRDVVRAHQVAAPDHRAEVDLLFHKGNTSTANSQRRSRSSNTLRPKDSRMHSVVAPHFLPAPLPFKS
jgi:hypothetical protein